MLAFTAAFETASALTAGRSLHHSRYPKLSLPSAVHSPSRKRSSEGLRVCAFLGVVAGVAHARARSLRRTAQRATFEASCDYLVVGAGATGMAFADTLLKHHPSDDISVIMVDSHAKPGGHWNDAYDFVKLHQSASNYGVESTRLENWVSHPELQASRSEIMEYYADVIQDYVSKSRLRFFPRATYNFSSSSFEDANQDTWVISASAVVDARFTEPDIPAVVKPRFAYNSSDTDVVTPNELAKRSALRDHFCVIGGGKTGQDCILYLQEKLGVEPKDISWVVPRDSWITARPPPMDTCMEFIQTCLETHNESTSPGSVDFVQRGFLHLEKRGKVYRIDKSVQPTKFWNATLNAHEVDLLRNVSANIIREGRVSNILDSGELCFASGAIVSLPWENASESTSFVHCSAGAFNFSRTASEGQPAVFQPGRITAQEIFSFPGFCFNGSLIARLECESLSLDEKNAMCELPSGSCSEDPLGPSGGDIGPLHEGHGLVVALKNLRRWYARPGLGEWLHSSRLFSLTMNGYTLAQGKALADKNWKGLVDLGIVGSTS